VKNIIFGLIVFIHRNKYVQITQTGIHQYTMHHNIQALLDMSPHSHNSHMLILHLSNLLLGDQQSIQIGAPSQAIYYIDKTHYNWLLL